VSREEEAMNRIICATIATLSLTGSACYKPTTRISGPVESKHGVKVELVDVQCHELGDSDDGHSLELAMKLAVTNGSETMIQFFPERVRLLEPRVLAPSRTDSSCAIEKGERRIARVYFEDRRGASCTQRMKLDPADSMARSERTVRVEPLAFIAEDIL
jgi:hypothetical protein